MKGIIVEYIKENLDSVAFGKNILKIENIDISVNFNDFEDEDRNILARRK